MAECDGKKAKEGRGRYRRYWKGKKLRGKEEGYRLGGGSARNGLKELKGWERGEKGGKGERITKGRGRVV